MKHYAFEIIRFEADGEATCKEVAGRDVIASAIERQMWVKNICFLDLRLIDDYEVDEYEVESRENDEHG